MLQGLEEAPFGTNAILKLFGKWVVPEIEFESVFLRENARRFAKALEGYHTALIYVGESERYSSLTVVMLCTCTWRVYGTIMS